MAYFWRCPACGWLGTFDDDEEPECWGRGRLKDEEKHYGTTLDSTGG